MSGKFMNVKRIMIPTITLVIIASQLMGCAAASESELLQMINNGDQIEIEVAVPVNSEQGTEVTVEWVQLDQLQSQPELRDSIDDIFKIIAQDESKNGVLYVNLDGMQDGNNTLFNVFANGIFRSNYWNKEEVQKEIATAASNVYVDVEFEDRHYDTAVLAATNAYFNILNDSEDGYANMDSTISRIEAMAAIFKAEYPVSDELALDNAFNEAIGVDSSNEYAIFASNLSEQSYLTVDSGSLDSHTAQGTITRGELAYILVQKYFADDYNSVDAKATCYSDVVNGGDIASAQKFIENGTAKEGWQAYELLYALQNVDKGCPERMYKALVVAQNKGIITDSECRWDEAVTKADFLEMLTNTYMALPVQVSAERGTITGYEVTEEVENEENINDIGAGSYQEGDEVVEDPVVQQPEVREGTVATLGMSDEEITYYADLINKSKEETLNLNIDTFWDLVKAARTGGGNSSGGNNSGGNNGGSNNSGGGSNNSGGGDNGNSGEGSGAADLPVPTLNPDGPGGSM